MEQDDLEYEGFYDHLDVYVPTGDAEEAEEAPLPSSIIGSRKRRKISLHLRKSLFFTWYGAERTYAKCCVCQMNEIGVEDVTAHMSHVRPHGMGGGASTFDLIPACSTCNLNLGKRTNMLDQIARYHPHRLVSIVYTLLVLWTRDSPDAGTPPYYGLQTLDSFVRHQYGGKDEGGVGEPRVYAILRRFGDDVATLRRYEAHLERAALTRNAKDVECIRHQRDVLREHMARYADPPPRKKTW